MQRNDKTMTFAYQWTVECDTHFRHLRCRYETGYNDLPYADLELLFLAIVPKG